MRTLVALSLLAGSTMLASAQANFLATRYYAGYTWSGHFTGKNGNSGDLTGLEFGADIPIGPGIPTGVAGPITFSFSPSYFAADIFGGSLRGGVFRALGTARFVFNKEGVYAQLGAGYAYANSENNSFNSQGSYEVDYVLGVPILRKLPLLNLGLQATYHQSSLAQASGFSIGLNASF